MFLRLFNFIRGYVITSVSGFTVERFLNLAANKGIYLWDVHWRDGAAVVKTSVKGFKLLRPCAKKTGCKLRIIRKVGLPFAVFRYRKRKFLAFGILFFIGCLYFITSFVWLVTIEGNETIESAKVSDYLAENGLRAGGFKYGFNLRLLENKLMSDFPDIAWVNISIKGTRVRVIMTETLPKPEIVDKNTPVDIVAKKDGLIVGMATSAGTPLVKPGDVVRKGDMLVKGELVVGNEDSGFFSYFVHARAEIYAKMYYEFSFDIPLNYTIKSFSGKTKRNYGIILFGNVVYLENTESPFVNYDKIADENRLNFGEDYPLPVVWFTETYREFIPVEAERTFEEAEALGEEAVSSRLDREFPPDARIIDKKIDFERGNGFITVTARITTIERIDEARVLPPDTPLDGSNVENPGSGGQAPITIE